MLERTIGPFSGHHFEPGRAGRGRLATTEATMGGRELREAPGWTGGGMEDLLRAMAAGTRLPDVVIPDDAYKEEPPRRRRAFKIFPFLF